MSSTHLAWACSARPAPAAPWPVGVGPAQSVLIGDISGIGGGILRDVLLSQIPIVLRTGLYALPALLGAAVVPIAHTFGADGPICLVIGAALCVCTRMIGLLCRLNLPNATSPEKPSERATTTEPAIHTPGRPDLPESELEGTPREHRDQ
jgi:Glycine transporter